MSRPAGSFLTPGYPLIQIAFCLVAAAVVASVVSSDSGSAARGALLLALGVPVYYAFARRRTGRPAPAETGGHS